MGIHVVPLTEDYSYDDLVAITAEAFATAKNAASAAIAGLLELLNDRGGRDDGAMRHVRPSHLCRGQSEAPQGCHKPPVLSRCHQQSMQQSGRAEDGQNRRIRLGSERWYAKAECLRKNGQSRHDQRDRP